MGMMPQRSSLLFSSSEYPVCCTLQSGALEQPEYNQHKREREGVEFSQSVPKPAKISSRNRLWHVKRMFRNYVFVSMVNSSPPADVIMGGQGRKIGTRERRERRGGGALVCGREIRRRLVHPLRKIKGAKMRGKKERLFRIKRASMQSEMGKCYWVNADSRLKEKTL